MSNTFLEFGGSRNRQFGWPFSRSVRWPSEAVSFVSDYPCAIAATLSTMPAYTSVSSRQGQFQPSSWATCETNGPLEQGLSADGWLGSSSEERAASPQVADVSGARLPGLRHGSSSTASAGQNVGCLGKSTRTRERQSSTKGLAGRYFGRSGLRIRGCGRECWQNRRSLGRGG